jgi:hypothetical protein
VRRISRRASASSSATIVRRARSTPSSRSKSVSMSVIGIADASPCRTTFGFGPGRGAPSKTEDASARTGAFVHLSAGAPENLSSGTLMGKGRRGQRPAGSSVTRRLRRSSWMTRRRNGRGPSYFVRVRRRRLRHNDGGRLALQRGEPGAGRCGLEYAAPPVPVVVLSPRRTKHPRSRRREPRPRGRERNRRRPR